MNGFHTVTPGVLPMPIASRVRAAAAPRQTEHTGSTIPEIAGPVKKNLSNAEFFLDSAASRFEVGLALAVAILSTLEAKARKKVEHRGEKK
jgi:hypothetical protein